jgi:hypothetical protein
MRANKLVSCVPAPKEFNKYKTLLKHGVCFAKQHIHFPYTEKVIDEAF